ncbi:MAG: hypothetical protein Q9M91_07410 [Candidatus Dojkabacteria bacterium]|nr:hypothetical protein [Candidatus Dojkabacteria bacterium]MDQ7021615.1 hypothetical protein [Candidatus Dojkabacteria bacterium]
MSKELIIRKLNILIENYNNGLIPKLHEHEVNPGLEIGSRENYLYFTLPVSLNFQRSSPSMWKAALETWEDPETNYLYFPEKVVDKNFEELQRDLVKHKLALQKNKHVQIWQRISTTLYEKYSSDPRLIFKYTQRCVTRTKNLIVENKKEFPYLAGPKMSNYWLYILDQFTDIKLRNKHKISIIPDTHVIQSSIKLGIIKVKIKPEDVALKWFDLLKDTKFSTTTLHPILWNWSRNNFLPKV